MYPKTTSSFWPIPGHSVFTEGGRPKNMTWKRRRALKATDKSKQQMQDRKVDDRDWAGLPNCLVELVIERLPLDDCLSFGHVCKPWRSIATQCLDGCSRGIPCLMKPGQSESTVRTCFSVLEKGNPSVEILMPGDTGSHVWGSYRDWLFLARRFVDFLRITLLDPFSREKVVLPKVDDDYHMLVVSAVPSDQRSIYMLADGNYGVAFWTSGAREWRRVLLPTFEPVTDALYHEGHFYLLMVDYEMVIIDEKNLLNMLSTKTCMDSPVHRTPALQPLRGSYSGDNSSIATQSLHLELPGGEIAQGAWRYIVESCGDILALCRFFSYAGPYVWL